MKIDSLINKRNIKEKTNQMECRMTFPKITIHFYLFYFEHAAPTTYYVSEKVNIAFGRQNLPDTQ